MNKTFNILIATTGRESLQKMIDSLIDQLTENDCITIVYDGYSTIPLFNFRDLKCKIYQYYESEKLGYWGHGIRNKYATLLEKKDFIMHADDDDIYSPDTFNKIRELCNDNEILYIGKFDCKGTILPIDNIIKKGNIGTPCGIIPYNINSQAEWKLQYGGDGIFYEDLEKISKNIIFLDICMYKVTVDTYNLFLLEEEKKEKERIIKERIENEKRIKFYAIKYRR